MSFELREHTADVAVEAIAPDLSTLFGAVANGLAAASCDEIPATTSAERYDVDVAAESLEALLFDYLDQLIYERDVRSVLPVDNRVQVRNVAGEHGEVTDNADGETDGAAVVEWRLSGTYRGIPLATLDAREVKAVTYSEMRVEETKAGWVGYVVFDV
ncbi:archease [Halobellus captivus]|uniref:archease n=1 Tax=Halobellus captivus TaxID=2592614 RepID=UPI0011A7A427|nr:archease [Halobellus captivus]